MIAAVTRRGRSPCGWTPRSSRSAGSVCWCSPPRARWRGCGVGSEARLATIAGGPRGLADAVRLRRRDERDVFELLQTVTGRRAAAGPGDARRARPRRAAPRRGRRGPRRAHAGAGHRRKGAQRMCWSSATGSARRTARTGARARPPPAPATGAAGTREQVVDGARRARLGRASRPRTASARCWPTAAPTPRRRRRARPTVAARGAAWAGHRDEASTASRRPASGPGLDGARPPIVDPVARRGERAAEAALRPAALAEFVGQPVVRDQLVPGAGGRAQARRRPGPRAARPARPGWARPRWP